MSLGARQETDREDADTATLEAGDDNKKTLDGSALSGGSATVKWEDVEGAKGGKYTITATVTATGDVESTDTITVTPTTGISLGEHVTALDAGCFEATTSATSPTYTLTVTEVAVEYEAAQT